MVTDPNDTSERPVDDGDQLLDQAAFDALLGEIADTASTPGAPLPPENASSDEFPGGISREDLDALVSASGKGGDPAEGNEWSQDSPPADRDGAPASESGSSAPSGNPEVEPQTVPGTVAPLSPLAGGLQSGSSPAAQAFNLADLDEALPAEANAKRVTMLSDVNLCVKIELGKARMLVEDVLKLGEGSVVELDKLAGDPVDVLVNDRLVARGEVLVLNDNFCVRVCEVISRDPHRVTE